MRKAVIDRGYLAKVLAGTGLIALLWLLVILNNLTNY